MNTGLDFPFVRSLLAVPNGGGTKILAGTWGAGIYLSTNNGSSWTSVNSGLVCRCVNALAACDSNLFVGTNGCAAFESTDGGASWGQINKGMDSPNVYALAVVPNGQGGTNILAGAGGIFLSTNSGANWVRLNSDNRSVMGDVHAFAMTGTESGTTKIFAGNNALDIHQVQVFVSGDNGHSWTQLGVNIDATRVNALAAFDVYVFVGTDNRGIFLSTDGGMHWVQRNNGLLDYSVNALTTSANDVGGMNIYAATSHGIFLSTDCGLNWRLTNTDQISTHAQSLAICRDRMFAAVSASVWQRPLSEIVSGLKGTGDNVPLRISLSQNYPNPFNPSTTIRFELPKDANVSLKVFNTLGQLIATFIDEPKRAGVYRVSWNASAVPSGSYFYRLSTGGIVETKKMIVVK
ncbi:MAG TPA: T9SS type A sorting domain-containing protein [Bacteroidota bacterium]|nr:T9SS type A sorting domain-containing protein [Bacteroidota bacterium]